MSEVNEAAMAWLTSCSFGQMSEIFFMLVMPLFFARLGVKWMLAVGMLSGYMILQYSEVRMAYPAQIVGRALALFTMSMFLGVAVMQWFTGLVASMAKAQGADIYAAVLLTIASLLAVGAVAFAWLPHAPRPLTRQPASLVDGR